MSSVDRSGGLILVYPSFISIYNITESVFTHYERYGLAGSLKLLHTYLLSLENRIQGNVNKLDHSFIIIANSLVERFFGKDRKLTIRIQNLITRKVCQEKYSREKIQVIMAELSHFLLVQRKGKRRLSTDIIMFLERMKAEELGQITVYHIAKEYGISIWHLSKKFKKEQGLNLKDVLLSIKIGRAYNILESQEKGITIKELSHLLGFRSVNHFRKTFKKKYGKTPGKIFNNLLKKPE